MSSLNWRKMMAWDQVRINCWWLKYRHEDRGFLLSEHCCSGLLTKAERIKSQLFGAELVFALHVLFQSLTSPAISLTTDQQTKNLSRNTHLKRLEAWFLVLHNRTSLRGEMLVFMADLDNLLQANRQICPYYLFNAWLPWVFDMHT